MTEKRFSFLENHSLRYNCIHDNEKGKGTDGVLYTQEVLDLLNTLYEEKEIYKRLFNEMAYYFRDDVKSLNDLDHKDFESLQLLAQGEYFDEESLCWCKVKLEDLE